MHDGAPHAAHASKVRLISGSRACTSTWTVTSRDAVAVDQPAHEVVIGLAGGRKADFDLLIPILTSRSHRRLSASRSSVRAMPGCHRAGRRWPRSGRGRWSGPAIGGCASAAPGRRTVAAVVETCSRRFSGCHLVGPLSRPSPCRGGPGPCRSVARWFGACLGFVGRRAPIVSGRRESIKGWGYFDCEKRRINQNIAIKLRS